MTSISVLSISLTIDLLLDALVLRVVLPDYLLQLLMRELVHRVQAEVHRLLLRFLLLRLWVLVRLLDWLDLGKLLLEVGVRGVASLVDHLRKLPWQVYLLDLLFEFVKGTHLY